MGIFFGPGSIFTKSGDATFVSGGKDGGDVITHSGDIAFSQHGIMSTSGDISFLSNGKNITKCGNTYFCGENSYTKSGDILFGSNGKTWSGKGMTDRDVRDIIAHDN
jgi:hypothetical protein